jgi:hypothetical protein
MKLLCFIVISFFLISCKSENTNREIDITAENLTEEDLKFKDVFKSLEGKWKGQFFIYYDINGQKVGNSQPKDINYSILMKLSLELRGVIEVEQKYTSASPYLQFVEIKDSHLKKDGNLKVSESNGVNKVENGRLVCIVNKPGEEVMHTGTLLDINTIIWQRNVKDPFRIEYFKETVRDDSYVIVGWGYYGKDDPKLSPRTWFYGDYKRVN